MSKTYYKTKLAHRCLKIKNKNQGPNVSLPFSFIRNPLRNTNMPKFTDQRQNKSPQGFIEVKSLLIYRKHALLLKSHPSPGTTSTGN